MDYTAELTGFITHKRSKWELLDCLGQMTGHSPPQSRGWVGVVGIADDPHQFGGRVVEALLKGGGFNVRRFEIGDSNQPIDDFRSASAILITSFLESAKDSLVQFLQQLKGQNLDCPVLVGGAGLFGPDIRQIVIQSGVKKVYAPKNGWEAAIRIVLGTVNECRAFSVVSDEPSGSLSDIQHETVSIDPVQAPPSPDDLAWHQTRSFSLETAWNWIRPRTLYNLHLGYRGPIEAHLKAGKPGAVALKERVDRIKAWVLDNPEVIAPIAAWQYFRCRAEGNDLVVMNKTGDQELGRWTLPRDSRKNNLCLVDYIHPTQPDYLGLMAATVGQTLDQTVHAWLDAGRFQDAAILHALGMQTAEAIAEHCHDRLRRQLALHPIPETTPQSAWNEEYQGRRYSFGYSACPDLAGQKMFFKLLRPERIGITLTQHHMMHPEGSVTALVFHHPQARYF